MALCQRLHLQIPVRIETITALLYPGRYSTVCGFASNLGLIWQRNQETSPTAMQAQQATHVRSGPLVAIKAAHTLVWALFAGCIVAIPFASWQGEHRAAAWLMAIVFVEVAVLALNRMRCPLTGWAGRYTDDRRDNFDIYLPLWLARRNKLIFGALYVAGSAFALVRWLRASG
jgi:hypothetical protein